MLARGYLCISAFIMMMIIIIGSSVFITRIHMILFLLMSVLLLNAFWRQHADSMHPARLGTLLEANGECVGWEGVREMGGTGDRVVRR